MRPLKIALGISILGGLHVPPAYAGDEPDVLEILKKVDAATRAVKQVYYEAEFFGEGDPDLVQRVGKVRGKAWAKEAKRGLFGNLFGGATDLMRFEGEVQLPGTDSWIPFLIACDGRTVYRIDPKAKTMMYAQLPEGQELLRRGLPLYIREFLYPTPFDDEINAVSTRYEGEKSIGGVACHVIYVVYRKMPTMSPDAPNPQARWYFGKKDFLPRRVDRIQMVGDKIIGATVQTIAELDTDPSVTTEDFRLQAPDGYEEREFEPEEAAEKKQALLRVGDAAPDWELKTEDGKTVRLRDLHGNVVVLGFWATYSGPSKLAMPGLQKLHEKFKGRAVRVYAVSCWERGGDPAKYLREKNLTLPLLVQADRTADAYQLENIPTLFVINTDGTIGYASLGWVPGKEQDIANLIEKLLAKRP